jgi:hypothetical protein
MPQHVPLTRRTSHTGAVANKVIRRGTNKEKNKKAIIGAH